MKKLIARAHKKNIKIWGATILPFMSYNKMLSRQNVISGKRDKNHEKIRQLVNTWIREAGAFDAVVDFDQVMRDPTHQERLLPDFDSGDHLHPNDIGYAVMAAAFDLHLLAQDN